MKKISAVLVAAACMFVMTASAFASDAPKADEKKDAAKKEEKKEGEVKPVDPEPDRFVVETVISRRRMATGNRWHIGRPAVYDVLSGRKLSVGETS